MTDSPAALPPAASIRRRLAAMLYDALLLIGVVFVGFLAPQTALGAGFGRALPGPLLAIHLLALLGFYFHWFWSRSGQTLAMRTWKIRLTAADGSVPSRGQLLLRFVLAGPSILTVAGLLWAVFDRDRQFMHDRLAGTRIALVG